MKEFLLLLIFSFSLLYSETVIKKLDKLPKGAEYDGEPKVIYQVDDKAGMHFIFLTRIEYGNFGEEGYRSEIRVYKYSSSPKGFQKAWEIKDFNTHALMNVEWVDNVFEVKDWDGDDVAEAVVIYKLSQDGTDPDFYKLIGYYKNKKFAIRYEMNKEEGPSKTPQVDKSISKLPKKVQQRIKQLWMKHVGAVY